MSTWRSEPHWNKKEPDIDHQSFKFDNINRHIIELTKRTQHKHNLWLGASHWHSRSLLSLGLWALHLQSGELSSFGLAFASCLLCLRTFCASCSWKFFVSIDWNAYNQFRIHWLGCIYENRVNIQVVCISNPLTRTQKWSGAMAKG